jgi:MFS family permease
MPRSPRWTLAVAAFGTLLVLADFSALVTTVGYTGRALGGGSSGQTWALSGMSLGLATALLTVGTLADELGRRRVLIWSAAALALASVLAAVAPSVVVFVVARVLQGIAGAGVISASLATIGHVFGAGPARTHATGVWGAALGAGIAIGPLAGAALAVGLGWRSGYWLQAAAAAALVPAAATLAESRVEASRPVDLAGAVALAGAMACATAGLVQGRSSWTSAATVALLACGAVLLGVFGAVELRRRAPMVDLRLLGHAPFVASVSGGLFTGLAIVSLMSYSASFYERALGLGAIASAGVLSAWSATSVVAALGARQMPARVPSHMRLALGLALAGAGELALTGLGTGSSWARLVPGLAIAGVGSGIANAALGRLAVESVPRERPGMGSGANNTARYLGGAAGVALVVAVVAAVGGGAGTPAQLVHGWNAVTLSCAGLCGAGAAVAAACRPRVGVDRGGMGAMPAAPARAPTAWSSRGSSARDLAPFRP